MDTLTTGQVRARLAEHQRIIAGPYDAHQVKESRRAVKLYSAELITRQS